MDDHECTEGGREAAKFLRMEYEAFKKHIPRLKSLGILIPVRKGRGKDRRVVLMAYKPLLLRAMGINRKAGE